MGYPPVVSVWWRKIVKKWTQSKLPAKAKKKAAQTAMCIPCCSSQHRCRRSRGRSFSCSHRLPPSSRSSLWSRLAAVSVISTTLKCRMALLSPESVVSLSARRSSQSVRSAANFALVRFNGCFPVSRLKRGTRAKFGGICAVSRINEVTL